MDVVATTHIFGSNFGVCVCVCVCVCVNFPHAFQRPANLGTRHHRDASHQFGSPQLNPRPELLTSQRHVLEVCSIKVPKKQENYINIPSGNVTQQWESLFFS